MIDASLIITMIAGMFLVTYPVRLVPFVLCNRAKVPRIIERWLAYVPVCIFAGLLTQIFIGSKEAPVSVLDQMPLLVSCCLAVLITLKTKCLGWGMGLGFAVYVAIMLVM